MGRGRPRKNVALIEKNEEVSTEDFNDQFKDIDGISLDDGFEPDPYDEDEDEDDYEGYDDYDRDNDVDNNVEEELEMESSVIEISDESSEKENNIINWYEKLNNTKEEIHFDEFNSYRILYKKVKDPEDINSKYFSCHISKKENDKFEKWVTSDKLVSSNYIIGNLEKFIENIKANTENEITNERISNIDWDKFLIGWTGETSKKVNVFSDDTLRLIFSIFSGVQEGEQDIFGEFQTKLKLKLINSYNGKKSFSFDFVLEFSNKTHPLIIDDSFILNSQSERISHKGSFGEIGSGLVTIENNISNIIEKLKSDTENVDSFIKEIKKRIGKKIMSKFNAIWDNAVPSDYKNMLFAFLTLSYILNQHGNSIELYSNIRPIVTKFANK